MILLTDNGECPNHARTVESGPALKCRRSLQEAVQIAQLREIFSSVSVYIGHPAAGA